MSEAIYLTDKTCPICGKVFAVLHPDRWAYRIKPHTYFCSWGCLRVKQKEKEIQMAIKAQTKQTRLVLSQEQTEKDVQIYYAEGRKAAIEGGNQA